MYILLGGHNKKTILSKYFELKCDSTYRFKYQEILITLESPTLWVYN